MQSGPVFGKRTAMGRRSEPVMSCANAAGRPLTGWLFATGL